MGWTGIEMKPEALKDEHRRKGLRLREVQLRRNKEERWQTKRWWCVTRTPEVAILVVELVILSDEKN